jgi:hypothetical protein
MSQIYYNIWLGGYEEAEDKTWLMKNGITHILNATAELEIKFPKKYTYKSLPLLNKENFDALPYLDSAADFILKAIEEGNLLIHGYRDESRGPACLMAFLMKFFGWEYLRCYKTILGKRPSTRFFKNHDRSIHQYYEELIR